MGKTSKSICPSVLFVMFVVFAVADSGFLGCRDWSYSSTWQGSCLGSPNSCVLYKCVCYDGKGCPQGRLSSH
ncbi:hypothetical protein D8674_031427 [Pyrus ussuriensis x Pyrus communis]|uniref:Uncharacterized protein n=1 Tax=Pyrus ussuriensis x Pyrus communis TaxID=2448454 RepID=A0A5N5EZ27_9ROSA|nr:hypothetical protein D8674_031427 [Pyrus ussuriensis x Pyrus communis]